MKSYFNSRKTQHLNENKNTKSFKTWWIFENLSKTWLPACHKPIIWEYTLDTGTLPSIYNPSYRACYLSVES
jgi:hypothetical protein